LDTLTNSLGLRAGEETMAGLEAAEKTSYVGLILGRETTVEVETMSS